VPVVPPCRRESGQSPCQSHCVCAREREQRREKRASERRVDRRQPASGTQGRARTDKRTDGGRRRRAAPLSAPAPAAAAAGESRARSGAAPRCGSSAPASRTPSLPNPPPQSIVLTEFRAQGRAPPLPPQRFFKIDPKFCALGPRLAQQVDCYWLLSVRFCIFLHTHLLFYKILYK
jgi:hypothetical protein